MHEFSMAEELLDVIKANAEANNAKRVTSVKLKMSNISLVTPEALSLSFKAVSKGTIAEDASLIIEMMPLIVRCRGCYLDSKIDRSDTGVFRESPLPHFHSLKELIYLKDLFRCKGCGCKYFDVISDDEIYLEKVELDV